MARTSGVEFQIIYKLSFESVIRGHHVYKTTWTPKGNDELECHEDTRKEAKDYDGHAVGLFKTPSRGENKTLVGHVPIEISSLIDYFLKADKSNSVSAQVTGKRKRELGLVVPARFTACTATRRQAQILDSELNKFKAKFVHLELIYEPGLRSYPTCLNKRRIYTLKNLISAAVG